MKKQKLIELCRYYIAGVQYYDYKLALEKGLKDRMYVDLLQEKENPHDKSAIRIEYQGIKLGYVPKGNIVATGISPQVILNRYHEAGETIYSSIVKINRHNQTYNMFLVKSCIEDFVK